MIIYILSDMIFIIFSAYMIYIIFKENQYSAVIKSLTGFGKKKKKLYKYINKIIKNFKLKNIYIY